MGIDDMQVMVIVKEVQVWVKEDAGKCSEELDDKLVIVTCF